MNLRMRKNSRLWKLLCFLEINVSFIFFLHHKMSDSKDSLTPYQQLQDKLDSLDWEKLKCLFVKTFAIPEQMEEKLWDHMCNYDCIGLDEEFDSHMTGSSDSMSFAFDYLLHDTWARDLGFFLYVEKDQLTEEERKLIQSFHDHLRAKFSAESYLHHLKSMLPEMNGIEQRENAIRKIWS